MIPRRTVLTTLGAGLLLGSSGLRALAAPPHCGPTGRATAGPFYVGNTPTRMDINFLGAPGQLMEVGGFVLGGADHATPLAGVAVELWHADADGRYHPEDDGDITRYRAEEINLRGQVRTGADGGFAFRSVVPGHYGNRRRHLHWRVVAPGHRPLVTQTYWRDEKGSRHERTDPVDRDPEDCRWIAFAAAGDGVRGEVVFVLSPA